MHDSSQQQILHHLAHTIVGAQNLEQLVRPLLDLLLRVTRLESTFLTSVDLQESRQQILYALNDGALSIPEHVTMEWVDSLCKRAMDEETPYVTNVQARWPDLEVARALGIQTYLGTPIRTLDGRLCGTLCAASSTSEHVDSDTQLVLQMFSHLIGQQIDRERTLDQLRIANAALEASASQDMLTGLPNRRALMDALHRRLAQRKRSGEGVLLAFIDLDDFKSINDRYGHEIGDHFLMAIARVLEEDLRAGDIAARLGGDEFVVLATVDSGGEQLSAQALHDRIDQRLRGRFTLGTVDIDYDGASIGIALAADHDTPDSLLSRADGAMYARKEVRARRNAPEGHE